MNWSRTKSGFHDPDRFAHLVLSPSAETVAGLAIELRKGERKGPIAIEGSEAFANAAYRALAAEGIELTREWIVQLAAAGEAEKAAATKKALAERIVEYSAELDEFEQIVESDDAPSREVWTGMTARLGEIRQEVDRVIWEARLAGLISEI
jgi:hypothetical protein